MEGRGNGKGGDACEQHDGFWTRGVQGLDGKSLRMSWARVIREHAKIIVSQEDMIGVTLVPHLVPEEGHLQTVLNGGNTRTPRRAAGMNEESKEGLGDTHQVMFLVEGEKPVLHSGLGDT